MRQSACTFAAVLLLILAGMPTVGAKEPSYNEKLSAFKKALRSKDPKARSRAFELLRGVTNPNVVEEITRGIRKVESEESAIHKRQEETEATYEKAFTSLEDAKADLDVEGHTGKAMKRYNKRAKKIAKTLDDCRYRLKNLQNDFTRNRALLQQAVVVMGEILDGLEGDPLEAALAQLSEQWLQKKEERWKRRWVDAVTDVKKPKVTRILQGVVETEDMPDTLRVAAMDALAARADGWIIGKGIEYLKLPPEKSPLVKGAIAALRTMHDKRGIPPLIDFLARQDIKVERNLAQLALVSLTGVDHGPYDAQWKKWWLENSRTFQMPKDPRPTGDVAPPKKGTTFYGVQTFSDRILYIVDISGSMDKPQKGTGAAGKTKMDVCRQELIGSVYNLNKTDTFNVIFFNHQVIPWQQRKVEATDRNKSLLKSWVSEQMPLGATNIYDSLEMGFKIAHRMRGPAALDTIFFLTDGRPTAGKVRDLDTILEVVKEWNQAAKMTIHCIGIGKEHDADFLKALARIGDGKYVRR